MTRQPIELTDLSNSPEERRLETEKIVPDSFADWLSQPSRTITAGPQPPQGGTGSEKSCVHVIDGKAAEPPES